MRSDNLTAAGPVPEWVFRLDVDPVRPPDTDDEPWRPEPAARPRPCRAAALALAALALGVALGRLSR